MNKPNDVRVSRELLPCPFCGSSDVKIVTDDGIHFAQCCKCEATGPTGFKRGDEGDADWNTRAQPADQQGEPVYQVGDGVNGWEDVSRLHYTACCLDPEEFEVRVLYRHARPATTKVDERAEFETWFTANCTDEGLTLERCAARPEQYELDETDQLYRGWQARAKLNGGQT